MKSDPAFLLHCCCAPCSGGIIESLLEKRQPFTVFFFNPNIFPKVEYKKRKDDVVNFCRRTNTPFVDGDYDEGRWADYIRGHETEPERGKRCSLCFEFRLKATALFASQYGFSAIATTLGISRMKDLNQVNNAGAQAVLDFPDVKFLPFDWRKDGGVERMKAVSGREKFYRQNYCGCRFSLQRERNAH
jgi:predicted adenine nucleotide alpha hydrolase (AANH) superfamily ATPase